jgi:DNA-binding protein YbaB
MFDQFKAIGAIASLMKEKDRLGATVARVRTRLDGLEAVGEAGGGAVRAIVNGSGRVLSIEIEAALGAGFGHAESHALAETLIVEAVNAALKRAQDEARTIIEGEARELGLDELLPGLEGLIR